MKTTRTLFEIRKAILNAYTDLSLREKFDAYLNVTERPHHVPSYAWNTELLFADEYSAWPAKEGWCKRCHIRKRIHGTSLSCFLCTGRKTVRRKGTGCEFIYPHPSRAPRRLVPSPDKNLPGSRCGEPTADGKFCKRHIGAQAVLNRWMDKLQMEADLNNGGVLQIPRVKRLSPDELEKKYPMSRFYRNLAPKLEEYLGTATSMAANEIFDVREELMLARAAVAPFVQSFQNHMELYEKEAPGVESTIKQLEAERNASPHTFGQEKAEILKKCKDYLIKMQSQCGELAQRLLKTLTAVTELADKGSTIFMRHANIVDTNQLQRVSNQILMVINNTVGPDHAPRIEAELNKVLNLPQHGMSIASINPDEMLREMAMTMGMQYREGEMIDGEENDGGNLEDEIKRLQVVGETK